MAGAAAPPGGACGAAVAGGAPLGAAVALLARAGAVAPLLVPDGVLPGTPGAAGAAGGAVVSAVAFAAGDVAGVLRTGSSARVIPAGIDQAASTTTALHRARPREYEDRAEGVMIWSAGDVEAESAAGGADPAPCCRYRHPGIFDSTGGAVPTDRLCTFTVHRPLLEAPIPPRLPPGQTKSRDHFAADRVFARLSLMAFATDSSA